MTGSHLDTQPTGGKFDGAYGVMAGLEVLRVLHDSNYVTEAPIEVAVWTNEEGCRFAPAMVASGVFGGAFDLDFALGIKDREGVSFGIGYHRGPWIVDLTEFALHFKTRSTNGISSDNFNGTYKTNANLISFNFGYRF